MDIVKIIEERLRQKFHDLGVRNYTLCSLADKTDNPYIIVIHGGLSAKFYFGRYWWYRLSTNEPWIIDPYKFDCELLLDATMEFLVLGEVLTTNIPGLTQNSMAALRLLLGQYIY
jgi:hypothetical protein